jgi:glycolate oxidase
MALTSLPRAVAPVLDRVQVGEPFEDGRCPPRPRRAGIQVAVNHSLPESISSRVVTDPDVARSYGVDATVPVPDLPEGFTVVRARDAQDVSEVLRHAEATGTPVVPQGARTSRAGGARATEGAIVLNVEALNRIVDLDPVEGHAVVQPGVVNADLKRAAAAAGLFYAPDPASFETSTIGGNAATNAGGLCCVKYGVTSDWIKALTVVLPGGTVMRTGHRTAKGVAGYDLTGLFVGSEGTLGVITEVVTKLAPAPEPALTALATFRTLGEAAAGIASLRTDPHRPSLLEIIDRDGIAAVQAFGDYGFPEDCEAVLLVQSDRAGHTNEDVQRYAELLEGVGAEEVAVADDEQEAHALTAGRRVLSTALEALSPGRLVEDVCVPIGQLADFMAQCQRIAEGTGMRIPLSGHGGDGNLHPSILFTPGDKESEAGAARAFDLIVRAALDLGGTISGEHGIGEEKRDWLVLELGAEELARQRQVKAVFDPSGIMNPGKLFV